MEEFTAMMVFLNKLRLSGKVNMFGAASYLQRSFHLNKEQSKDVLIHWMHNFDTVKDLK